MKNLLRSGISLGVAALVCAVVGLGGSPASVAGAAASDSVHSLPARESVPALGECAGKPIIRDHGLFTIERVEARQELIVRLAEGAGTSVAAAGRPGAVRGAKAFKSIWGKVQVQNRSPWFLDVYWSLDDDSTPWYWVEDLLPRWKVKFALEKYDWYLLAAEEVGYDDGDWDYGPVSFFLSKNFKWFLY